MSDTEFIDIINEYYPFERYIVKNPKSIEPTFDDLVLTELFVPNTEIKPIMYNDRISYWTKVNPDEIYVKVKGKAGEIRIGYYDFADHIREEIRGIILGDFTNHCWENLYVEWEDTSDLETDLNEQKTLIETKYGECKIKRETASNYLIHV